MHRLAIAFGLVCGLMVCGITGGAAEAQRTPPADWPVYAPPVVQALSATEISRMAAPEAGQGVAVDRDHVYAVGNFVIAKYDRKSGTRLALWRGERGGEIGHLNACYVDAGDLWCANSNHPKVPFANSVEIFDAAGLEHRRSIPLGIMDEGSLVWFDRLARGWIVGLAQYSDETGLPFKNNTYSGVFLFDADWRRTGGWALPPGIVERMAPQAASGGAIGPDGLLYVMGHDRPEMYVLARPTMGPYLLHIATIAIDAEGQAFDFDRDTRDVCAISRPNRQIRCFRLPDVALPARALRFE